MIQLNYFLFSFQLQSMHNVSKHVVRVVILPPFKH